MAGIFSAASVKIHNLLGLTARGQVTKANSLPVTLASDDDAVAVLGAPTDAAVVTDAVGTLSGKLRGIVKILAERFPASLGQKAKAASLPVTLASDEDILSRLPATIGQKAKAAALAVTLASDEDVLGVSMAAGADVSIGNTTDAAASSTVPEDATPRTGVGLWKGIKNILILIKTALGGGLPATIGQKAKAAALAVTLASDEDILSRLPASLGKQDIIASLSMVQANSEIFDVTSAYKRAWCIYRGAGMINDAWDGDKGPGAGGSFNIYAVRGTEGIGVAIDTLVEIQEYFLGGHANMNTDPIWIFIPLTSAGYKNYWLNVRNDLAAGGGVNLAVTVFGAMANGLLFSTGVFPVKQVTDARGSYQVDTATIVSGAVANFGNGGTTFTTQGQWPFSWLIVKAVPAADPSSGSWSLGIVLSS